MNFVDTNKKAARLEQSALKLDELKGQFEQSGLGIDVYRDEYCWRTTEKYSDGVLYCDQRLIAVGLNKTTDVQIKESGILLPMVEMVFENDFVDKNYSVYTKNGYISASSLLAESDDRLTACGITYSAFDESRTVDELSRNVYSIDIQCNEYIKSENIYPIKSNSSWESYVKPNWWLQ